MTQSPLTDYQTFSPLSENLTLEEVLERFLQQMEQQAQWYIGYPENLNFDYTMLQPFWQYHISNHGDPFIQQKLFQNHSKQFEQYCLQWFAQLYELDEHWGYLTTGGTEGNLYGLFVGRELYPDGILYSSQDSHFSVPKAARILRIPYVEISSQPHGEIDYQHLYQEISTHHDRSIILNLNLGTTMKGAVDRLECAVEVLEKLGIEHFHIHCDAALAGMLLPFIPEAPSISFRDFPIGSITVSGHKFIGSPIPFGITLTRWDYIQKIGEEVEYLGTDDITITGARCGITPLFLWYAIATRSQNFPGEVATCLETARYLRDHLADLGLHPLLNDFSTTVAFPKPDPKICYKWQLATQGNLAHVVVMQHVTKPKIDRFIRDLL
ncbi:MAG: histidine decarboxylase [Xenococcaceae cyanobacterium]